MPPDTTPPLTGPRMALSGLLAALLLWAGWNEKMLFALLARGWQAVFEALGLGGVMTRLQQGTSSQVTMHSVPAMLTGSVLYVVGCIVLLHLLLRSRRRTWWVVQVYMALLGLCLVLLVIGKVDGNNVLAYKLARRIINFVVSLLPVMLLLPLLWPGWGRRREREVAP